MTRSEHIRALLEEYAAQRARDGAEQDARIAEVEARDPELARLRADSARLALGTMRTILSLPTEAARIDAAKRMKRQGLANNAEVRRRLARLGYPEDYMEPRYRCPVCRDTGYVGDAPSRFCDCFLNRLRDRQHEDGSMAGADEQRFERFDLSRIPEEDGQRARMAAARKLCEAYADDFPDTRFRNLLLTGAGGLGKTFLLNCVYVRVRERGEAAVRTTAFGLFEAMRRRHMGESAEEFTSMVEAPLLLIDDLGAEPMMRNITVEYLFLLFNERTVNRRHTVVATNLSPEQLQDRYGERVASRLMDRSLCAAIQFKGRNLRTL